MRFTNLFLLILFALSITSCGFKISSKGSRSGNLISGIISPFLGSIAKTNNNIIISSLVASPCVDPVHAKLFKVENDGTINDSNPIASQEISSDAKYSFNVKELNITDKTSKVKYLVKASGCNGDVFKRPVTNFDSKQDIDAKTTVVAEVINANSLVGKKLNEAEKKDVEFLIKNISGSSTSDALNSLTSNATNSTKFNQVFGSSPTVIQDAKPEVVVTVPSTINELSNAVFKFNTFHVDPNYSFAYKWKLDGVVKASTATWNYIPGANDSGLHQVDMYVGQNNGSGNIDLAKPYYMKSISIMVNDNVAPIAPNFALKSGTVTPVNSNYVDLDINTGTSFSNCSSFNSFAITESNVAPNVGLFTLSCQTAGTQVERFYFTAGDGSKSLYIWAKNNEGVISSYKTLSFVVDTTPPVLSISFTPTLVKAGSTKTFSYSASDSGAGMDNVKLYITTDNTTYSLVSTLTNNGTSASFTVPAIDTVNAKLKIVGFDLSGSSQAVYSNQFTIDNTAPTSPSFSISSANPTSSSVTSVTLSSCPVDVAKVILLETNVQPTGVESGWANCNASTGAHSITLTGDGVHQLYLWSQDLVGNISLAATNTNVTLDTAAPVIASGPNLSSSIFKGGITTNITWSASDTTTLSASLYYTTDNGSTFQTIATGLSNTGSYTWSVPSINSTNVKIKIVLNDLLSFNSNSLSNAFTIDSTAPSLSLTSPATLLKGGDTITLNYSATDNYTLSTLELSYAADGVTFGAPTSLTVGSNSSSWVVNSANVSTAKLKLTATDAAGNVSTSISNSFTIDSTPPSAPIIARASAALSNSTSVTLTVSSCTDINSIYISESSSAPTSNSAGWLACSTAAGNYTQVVTGADGVKTIYAWSKDSAGNVSTSSNSITMTLDTSGPSISAINIASSLSGGSSTNITWTASDLSSFTVGLEYFDGSSWNSIATGLSNSGTYSWTVPSLNLNNAKIRLTGTDSFGQSSNLSSSNFVIDSSAPTLSTFSIAGNLKTVGNRNLLLSLQSVDALSNISGVCFLINSNTKPTTGNSCWVPVSSISGVIPALNINIVDFPVQLGVLSGVYSIYIFTKDIYGHISDLTNSGAGTEDIDKLTITYVTNPAPTVTNIIASNTDTPSSPLTSGEQVTSLGTDIYVQWNASDDTALPANAITIQYTLNDSVFTNIVTGLSNGSNNGCTVASGYTGCYRWASGSPSNSFVRLKVIANDGDNNASSVSNPLNTSSVNFLAGNTDHGIGGSAISAIFTSYNESNYNDFFDDRQFVVTKNGFVFIRSAFDDSILYIDPTNGSVNYLVKKTGVDSGDGGSVFSATIKATTVLELDHQDNLLIISTERVRKVDLHSANWTITTLFGGGATVSNSTNPILNATSVNFSAAERIYGAVTSNGRFYFFNSRTMSYYDYSDQKVYYVSDFNGLGAMGSTVETPSFDVTFCGVKERAIGYNISTGAIDKVMSRFSQTTSVQCNSQNNAPNAIANFDVSTGASTSPHPPNASWGTDLFTGMDGQIYALWHGRTTVKKYIKSTNTWQTVVGNGTAGRCADNTLATSCSGIFMSAFVNSLGTIYVMDMGVVRYIDSAGKIQTLFGQRRDFGVGYSPLSSRLSLLNSFAVNGSDVYMMNTNERKITKFSLNGGTVTHIAGNSIAGSFTIGSSATSQPLTDSCGWSNSCMIQVDGLNNRLYFPRISVSNLAYVDLNTGLWQQNSIAGTPGTSNIVGINPSSNQIIGYYGYSSTPVVASAMFVSYDYSLLTSTRVYGPTGNTSTPLADRRICWDSVSSTQLASCDGLNMNFPFAQDNTHLTRIPFDTFDSTWKIGSRNTNKIYSLAQSGSTTLNLYSTVTSSSIMAYDIKNDGVTPMIYYCGIDGKLYKKNVNTGVETNLPLPLTSIKCMGSSLFYSSSRNSIIFGYQQNLLYGIAEYRNP